MNKKLLGLLAIGIAVVLTLTFGMRAVAQAGQTGVDKDLAMRSAHDANFFGEDKAYTSASGGPDQDLSPRAYKFMPDNYAMGMQNPRH